MRRHTVATILVFGSIPFAGNWSMSRGLSFEDRVNAQEAIERVYWNHRIWPETQPTGKPPLRQVMSTDAIRATVESYLRKSTALENVWQTPITAEEIQSEVHRIVTNTKDPGMLAELFTALGNDPFLIAECLARPILADRLVRELYSFDAPPMHDATEHETEGRKAFDLWWTDAASRFPTELRVPSDSYVVDAAPSSGCTDDTWAITRQDVPDPRDGHTAVWTGSEMIVWGGSSSQTSGGRYNPVTDTWTPTSITLDTPGPRSLHSAVWTGTEMIVWGGNAPGPRNTGGRYNPATDTWTATSTGINTPSARFYHSAVWTGSEMIVWGGSVSPGLTNSGGRYNPSTNTWTPTSVGAGVPTARAFHSAVWTGTEMIVWAGNAGAGPVNTGGRYNPSTNSWAATSTGAGVPIRRVGHTAVWTGTVMIVWGGRDGTSGPVNSGGRYNPSTNSWSATSTAPGVPSARSAHTAVWTGSVMVVWGGAPNLNGGGRYNPVTNAWAQISPNEPSGRSGHTAVWTGTYMVVWGGSSGTPNTSVNNGGRYNPTLDKWRQTNPGTTPGMRDQHTAVWTGTEMIVFGGSAMDPVFGLQSGGRYTPVTDSWTPTPINASMNPAPRTGHTAVWTGMEMIVWGGFSNGELNTGARFSTTTGWTAMSTSGAPSARKGHSAVWTGTEMIIWGGESGTSLNTGARYSPSTDSWNPTSTGANTPSARSGHTALWTGSEMIVWGGDNANTGGRYDPVGDSWTATSSLGAPTGRTSHTAVWTGTGMIVWGGRDSSLIFLNTGAIYDPILDSWSDTDASVAAPEARGFHTAVWTGTRMIVWGGVKGVSTLSYLNSGGRYEPGSDSWVTTSTGTADPIGRTAHTAVWTGSEMIVWGGSPPVSSSGGRYCASP